MSLILEALHKADRDREDPAAVPHLHSVHGPVSTPASTSRHAVGIYIIAVLLALILIALLFVLFRDPSQGSSSMQVDKAKEGVIDEKVAVGEQVVIGKNETTIEKVVTQSPVSPPAGARKLAPNTVGVQVQVKTALPNRTALDPEIAAIYAASDSESSSPEASPGAAASSDMTREVRRPVQASESVLDDERVAQMWEEVQRELPHTNFQEAPSTRGARQQQSATAALTSEALTQRTNSLAFYTDIPFLHQLPESFQEAIPSIMYSNHIYSEKGSAVILNGKTVRRGQTLAPNLKVRDILEDGIIMTFHEKPFKLGELSSWVNMP